MQAAVDANEIVARARDIELVRAKKSKLRVMGDPALLQIAVSNLIANAVKYSPDHTRVGVGVRSTKGFVEIAVTDQGVGIPRRTSTGCSNASTGSTPPAPVPRAARGSASPS